MMGMVCVYIYDIYEERDLERERREREECTWESEISVRFRMKRWIWQNRELFKR